MQFLKDDTQKMIRYYQVWLERVPNNPAWINGLEIASQIMGILEADVPDINEATKVREYLDGEWSNQHPSWFELLGIASRLVIILSKKSKQE